MTDQNTAEGRRPPDVIMVEDSAVDTELVVEALREAGVAVNARRVEDEPAFRAALDERLPDAILADWTLPNFSGRRALEIVLECCPEVPFIVLSGTISESSAVEVLRRGAVDYVYKHHLQQLGPTLIRALDEARTLRSLRESEEGYRRLFENSRDALMVAVPPSWSFAEANPATLQMFGVASKADLAAHGASDFWAELQPDGCPSSEKAREMVAITMREGSHLFEFQHRRLNGEEFPAEVLLTRMEARGQVLVQSTVRDITERKRADEELDRYRRHLEQLVETRTHELESAKTAAEEASQVKTEWMNRMSHELRTPLNAVIGFTGLLERERAGPLNEEQARYVGYVKQSAEHVLALVNDVLDLAKIEAGRLELHPEKLVVVDLLTGVVGMVSARAADKGLHLESKVFDPQLAVIADPLRLRQVVLNLVTNAIKFTQQGGVRIEAGRVGDLGLQIGDPVVTERLSALPDSQSAIVIRVVDTGIGIEAEDFSRVFGEFEQIDNPLSRAEEGTGLGLSLVKRLVGLHGGQVWIESEVGRGSAFYVALPG